MDLILGKSLAGHDKDSIYVVLCEDGDDLILVNGRNRTIEHPKVKRKKHVQPIKHFPEDIRALSAGTDRWTDESVRKIVKAYEKSHDTRKQEGKSVKSRCD